MAPINLDIKRRQDLMVYRCKCGYGTIGPALSYDYGLARYHRALRTFRVGEPRRNIVLLRELEPRRPTPYSAVEICGANAHDASSRP